MADTALRLVLCSRSVRFPKTKPFFFIFLFSLRCCCVIIPCVLLHLFLAFHSFCFIAVSLIVGFSLFLFSLSFFSLYHCMHLRLVHRFCECRMHIYYSIRYLHSHFFLRKTEKDGMITLHNLHKQKQKQNNNGKCAYTNGYNMTTVFIQAVLVCPQQCFKQRLSISRIAYHYAAERSIKPDPIYTRIENCRYESAQREQKSAAKTKYITIPSIAGRI